MVDKKKANLSDDASHLKKRERRKGGASVEILAQLFEDVVVSGIYQQTQRRKTVKPRIMIALTMVVGLAFTALLGAGRASAAQTKITLHRAQGVEQGTGEAVITDSALTIRVKDLKPSSVYTVWYVNMEPKHGIAGVGPSPYTFKTDKRGVATFKAKLDEQPFGTWQMLVIIRHPNGDPQDMAHKEDALWAPLTKSAGNAPANPCAAS